MTIHIGILLPTREQAISGSYAGSPLLAFAREAEQLGFDSLWAGDSLVARPRLDPLVVLSAAAAVTERITLGTAALTPVLRHPLVGANMVASLDHVSRGRLVLGLGSGFPLPETEAEFAAVGASFAGRAGRLDDVARLWRTAWRSTEPGAPTGYHGRYWAHDGLDALPTPCRPGGPPLWLASGDTPRVLARVAAEYDGWLPFLPSASAYQAAWREISRLAGGRPVVPGLYATVAVDGDRERARAELDDYVRRYYGRPLDLMSRVQAYGWGDVEECAEWLAGYVRAGARHIVLRVGSLDPRPRLKEIAEVLVPAVRATYQEEER